MHQTYLNGTWQLHDEPLSADQSEAARIAGLDEGWVPQPVPGDIHQGLMDAGLIKDPLLGLNSFDCRWTEDRSWWFRKQFNTDPAWLASDTVELELNGLDSNASIYLNDVLLGEHTNAFYPFVAHIKQHLNPTGPNMLLVRLTTGVENITPEQLQTLGAPVGTEAGNGRPERGDPRRAFVRKPQYSFGWDWSPRVATTAIAGDVVIRAWNVARIRDCFVQPYRTGRNVSLCVTATVDSWHFFSTSTGTVRLTITDENRQSVRVERTLLLRSGLNHVTFDVPLKNPRYWWPNGMGDQHRYTIRTELSAISSRTPGAVAEKTSYPEFKYGLRFIDVDFGDVAQDKQLFALMVNGKRVFSKGGDWIPADAIYARITAQKYDALVHEAQQANFNMLRVWGGGYMSQMLFMRRVTATAYCCGTISCSPVHPIPIMKSGS